MEALSQYGGVPLDMSALKSIFARYERPADKIAALERSGVLVRLKRGLYAVAPSVSNRPLSVELMANHLYGPSYVSREYALGLYGLIPERVYTVGSMTLKRSRTFENSLGHFEYTGCPANYYAIGITQKEEGDRSFFGGYTRKSVVRFDCLHAKPPTAISKGIAYVDFQTLSAEKVKQEFCLVC